MIMRRKASSPNIMLPSLHMNKVKVKVLLAVQTWSRPRDDRRPASYLAMLTMHVAAVTGQRGCVQLARGSYPEIVMSNGNVRVWEDVTGGM